MKRCDLNKILLFGDFEDNMQKPDPEDIDAPRSRPTSRRNSASSRRSSIQKEREVKKKSPLNSTSSSVNSTPKKQVKPNPDFCVTGRQLLKKSDRANSLPVYQRRPSGDAIKTQKRPGSPNRRPGSPNKRPGSPNRRPGSPSRKPGSPNRRPGSPNRRPGSPIKRLESPKKPLSRASKSRDTSLDDDMSLDLSQVSDFEDSNSKYGVKKFSALATSTPKNVPKNFQKPRSASMQVQPQKIENPRRSQKVESRQSISTFCSRDDLLYKSSSSASNYRYGPTTDLDYSSVSPEYSGPSSAELSPRNLTMGLSPRSQELHVSSCCISTWQDCSDTEPTKVEEYRRGDHGEWNSFWANYNNSVAEVPVKSYYDQCPTPYRTEDFNLADLDFSQASSRKRSPDGLKNLNSIIRNEGLHLTPRETQSMIKCAHILGNVLTKAIERRSKEIDVHDDQDDEKESNIKVKEVVETKTEQNIEEKLDSTAELIPSEEYRQIKKKSLTLNLKETLLPLEVKEEKRQETVTTQTDISLPNTKSAPRIFEKILRQLSKTSLEESLGQLEKKALESKELEKRALENRELKKKELESKELKKNEEDKGENKDTVAQD